MFMYNCNWMFTGIWWSQLCYVQNKTHTNLDLWLNPKLFGHFSLHLLVTKPPWELENVHEFSGFIYDRGDFNFINFELYCTTTCVLMHIKDGYEWALYLGEHAVWLSKSIHTMCWRNMKDLYSTNSFEDCNNILGW